jgi:hypothetical protein
MSVFVRFKDSSAKTESEEMGPFLVAQVRSDGLRVRELNEENEEVEGELAVYDAEGGLWWTNLTGQAKYESWDGVDVYTREESDASGAGNGGTTSE